MDALLILAIGMAIVLGGILALRLHAFLALILAAYVVATLTPTPALVEHGLSKKLAPEAAQKAAEKPVIERIMSEFGGTAGKVGILIALATIVGRCLLETGSADRIVRSLLRFFGEARASLAMFSSGFVLGIPVFFDTVFLLMIPLAKALRLRTGKNYTLYILSIIAGATMTHSLVPPTPGPLFIASELKVNLGLMIMWGCVVGLITAACGWLLARWLDKRLDIPLRETTPGSLKSLEAVAAKDESQLPPFWLAVTPILLPVILITASTLLRPQLAAPGSFLDRAMRTLGDPNIALGLAAAVGLWTLFRQGRGREEVFSSGVGRALAEAGSIILITSAGGAFGGMLQQSGIGPRVLELSSDLNIGIIPLAWAFTALIRVAQGSATVAMITSVGALAASATPEALGFNPLWVALAIGCGSKPLPWMNDSGFWVITKMSGMTEKECLSTFTPVLTLMGVVGLFVVMLLAWLFPLV